MAALTEQPSAVRPPVLSKKQASAIRVSPVLVDASHKSADEVYALLNTSAAGLTQADAEERFTQYGPNEVGREKRHGWLWRLGAAVKNPLVILLTILSAVTYATGDLAGGSVMALMVVLGVSLRFVQESRADSAAAKLKAMISVTATVIRDGQPKEVPLKEIVPGDVIKLAAGDMIPADVRLISCKDLFIVQASLTGESLPVEKFDAPEKEEGGNRWSCATSASWAPALKAEQRARWWWRRECTRTSAAWPAVSPGSRSRPVSTKGSTNSPG
jgi:P-type Mg2+ transporter